MAQMSPEGLGRHELYELLRISGMTHLATTMVRLGVASVNDITLRQEELLTAGVHQWQLDRVLLADPGRDREAGVGEFRRDLPVQRPTHSRASLTAALVAAHPNNRRESLRLFEQDILANSTNPSQDSRVRTYKAVCRAWQVEAFPLTLESIRCFGASLKAGGYRSAAVYFQAILGYQARHLHVAVEALHRSAIKDAVRSIRRGLGPAGLKDSFDVSYLSNIAHREQPEPFSVENPVHMLDVVVLGLWFMLREAELAAARLAHLTIDSDTVSLMVPVHKTDQVGSLSMRQLNCACRYRRHHLCPWHSAFRHLKRVRLHGCYVEGPSFPLVPDEAGLTPSKYKMIQHIRLVLQTAGIAVTRPDDQGVHIQRFNGHALRVSGAQMMGSGGIPIQLIQLLGRWSSQAVQRYVQTSHLSVVPSLPAQLLGSRPPQLLEDSGLPTPGGGAPTPQHPPTPEAGANTRAHGQQLRRHSGQLEQLTQDIRDLKLAIAPPAESFVIRHRSTIAHKGFQFEGQNHPDRWRTPCGWRYGTARFFRVPVLAPMHSRCKKCFDLPGQDSSDSEEESEPDASSSSSSEDDGEAPPSWFFRGWEKKDGAVTCLYFDGSMLLWFDFLSVLFPPSISLNFQRVHFRFYWHVRLHVHMLGPDLTSTHSVATSTWEWIRNSRLPRLSFEQAQVRHDENRSHSCLGRCGGWSGSWLHHHGLPHCPWGAHSANASFHCKDRGGVGPTPHPTTVCGIHPGDSEIWSPHPGTADHPGYYASHVEHM